MVRLFLMPVSGSLMIQRIHRHDWAHSACVGHVGKRPPSHHLRSWHEYGRMFWSLLSVLSSLITDDRGPSMSNSVSCEGNVTATRRFPNCWTWCLGLPGCLLSSSLSPHSLLEPDHEHPSRRNVSFNSRVTQEVQQQIDDTFSQDEYFPYFCLTKDVEMIRQLDWINIVTASVWLAWLVYLPAQFFPQLWPSPLPQYPQQPQSNRQLFDPNNQGVVDPRIDSMLFSPLPRLGQGERTSPN